MLELSLPGWVEVPSPAIKDSRDHGPQNLEFASSYSNPVPVPILWPAQLLQCSSKPMSTNPLSTTSWGPRVFIPGYEVRTRPSYSSSRPFRLGWEKESWDLEGEISGSTSLAHDDQQLPPTPAHVPVLRHPQGYQGLREVALSETIIRDFIIYFSSLRTHSSL